MRDVYLFYFTKRITKFKSSSSWFLASTAKRSTLAETDESVAAHKGMRSVQPVTIVHAPNRQ
jgi:hypothetical protein